MLSFLVILGGLAAYLYWLLSKKVQPALLVPVQTNFENIVPTSGNLHEEDDEENDEDIHANYGYAGEGFEDVWEKTKPVLVEDAETALLFEAERIMEAAEKIAASKTDVYAKLVQLLDGHIMFNNTVYKEAITKYIALIVKEECDTELTEQQLADMW